MSISTMEYTLLEMDSTLLVASYGFTHRKHWRTGNRNKLSDTNDQYRELRFHVEIIQPGM